MEVWALGRYRPQTWLLLWEPTVGSAGLRGHSQLSLPMVRVPSNCPQSLGTLHVLGMCAG